MNEPSAYRIELCGQVDLDGLNLMSPLAMTRECTSSTATFARVHTDQSGLLGLMRYLHGLGIIILSIQGISEEKS